jgi:hypothetical protein
LSSPVIQGCKSACSAVIRLFGSNVNNRSIKSFAIRKKKGLNIFLLVCLFIYNKPDSEISDQYSSSYSYCPDMMDSKREA